MKEVIDCETDPELPYMDIVFLCLLGCSVIIYGLVAFLSIENTSPLFLEQWKYFTKALDDWRQSQTSRGSVSYHNPKTASNPVTSLCLQLIAVTAFLRICFFAALTIVTGLNKHVPCGSFMEKPTQVSWLLILHDLGTLVLIAVLGGFCFYWREFEKNVQCATSIARVVIDQWSRWSIGCAAVLLILVLGADILYGILHGDEVSYLHLKFIMGVVCIVLGDSVLKGAQNSMSDAPHKIRYLQLIGFWCTMIMGFIRVADAVISVISPGWTADFDIIVVAFYTAAEIVFIVSVEAIVQPAELHLARMARTPNANSTAHRLSQSLSSFVLHRFDPATNERDSISSNPGAKKHSSDNKRMHEGNNSLTGRKSSFSSTPNSPLKASASEPVLASSRPSSLTDLTAAIVQSLMPNKNNKEQPKPPSDDELEEIEDVVVTFDGEGDIFVATTTTTTSVAQEEKCHDNDELDIEANHHSPV